MKSVNEELAEVKQNIRKQLKWQEHSKRIGNQIEIKQEKVDSLKRLLEQEKEDIEQLHSFSVANVFTTIVGNKQEKLNERNNEVIKAKLTYQEAYQTLSELKEEREEYQRVLIGLGDVNQQYDSLIQRKELLIHDRESIWSEDLFQLTEAEMELLGALEEYQEAIDSGETALDSLEEASVSFDKAKGWSTFDMFGGGLMTTAIKHSHLDDAKNIVHQAERRLRHFQDELLDIKNHLKVYLDISQLLSFADYFFDGIIVNWMVHDKISNAISQINETTNLVSNTLSQLRQDQHEIKQQLDQLSVKRIKLIEEA